MNDWKNIYSKKLISVEAAAAKIESGDRIWFGSSTSTPIQLMDAVVDRYAELEDVHIISSLFLYEFKAIQDPKYSGISRVIQFLSVLRKENTSKSVI